MFLIQTNIRLNEANYDSILRSKPLNISVISMVFNDLLGILPKLQ